MKKKEGQILIEIIIALTLGGLLVSAAAGVIAVSLRQTYALEKTQVAASLMRDTMDNLRSLAESDWNLLYSRSDGSQYHLQPLTGGSFNIMTGASTTMVGNEGSYDHSFLIDKANRDLCGIGNVTTTATTFCNSGPGSTGVAEDPSTLRVTMRVHWVEAQEITEVQYLTRHRNAVFPQANWSGGPGQEQFPAGSGKSRVNNQFSDASEINYSGFEGALVLESDTPTTLHRFEQSDWSGGVTPVAAEHSENRTGWDEYRDKGNSIVAGAEITINQVTESIVHTSRSDFSLAAIASTTISGSDDGGSIELTPQTPITAGNNTWTQMTSANIEKGGAGDLVADNNGYLYAGTNIGEPRWERYSIQNDEWDPMTNSVFVDRGGAHVFYNNYIYTFRGINNAFNRYDIADDSWIGMSNAPGNIGYGADLVSPGDGYIYAFKGDTNGAPSNKFYRYDIGANTWSDGAVADAPNVITYASGYGSLIYPDIGDYIYAFDGGSDFTKYSISSDAWDSSPSDTADPSGGINTGADLEYPDYSKYIYGMTGINNTFKRYSILDNTWEDMTAAPVSAAVASGLAYPGFGKYLYYTPGDNTARIYRTDIFATFAPVGTSTSPALDTGGMADFTTLEWDATIPDTQEEIEIQMRSGLYQTNCDSAVWENWASIATITTANQSGDLASTTIPDVDVPDNRCVQYRAILTTSDGNDTPQLNEVTINYFPLNKVGILTSSPLNTGGALTEIERVGWQSSGGDVRMQVRTSSDGVRWNQWCGYDDTGSTCSGVNYFEDPGDNDAAIPAGNPLSNLSGGWFQYKIELDPGATTVASTSVEYLAFDPLAGTNASSTSSVFDTGMASGTAVNAIMWQGTLNGGQVRFQIASSNCANGKTNPPDCNDGGVWQYQGPDGTAVSYYTDAPNVAIPVNLGHHNNKRYFRYKVFLTPNAGTTLSPKVRDIIINYSP